MAPRKTTNDAEDQVKDTGLEAEDEENMTTTPEKAQENDEKAAAEDEKRLERQIAKAEKSYKKQLEDMPKVKMTIPDDPLNPDDVVPIGWNGIVYAIPRGVEVEVPEVLRDIWQESYTKTQAVNKRIRESTKKEIKIL